MKAQMYIYTHNYVRERLSSLSIQEFSDWLESVSGLLEPETYRLWLRELEQLPEFQSWISRGNLAAHRPPVSQPRLPTADDDEEDYEDYQRRRSEDDIGEARGTFPGSIGRQAKNLFYDDVSVILSSDSREFRVYWAEKRADNIDLERLREKV